MTGNTGKIREYVWNTERADEIPEIRKKQEMEIEYWKGEKIGGFLEKWGMDEKIKKSYDNPLEKRRSLSILRERIFKGI